MIGLSAVRAMRRVSPGPSGWNASFGASRAMSPLTWVSVQPLAGSALGITWALKQIAQPLYLSGISHDAGFSLNVANFYTTAQSVAYGRRLSKMVGGKHFVIDTSRNGNGAPPGGAGVNEWCNPPGRALGHVPTLHPGIAGVDALLWVKYPGQSDGSCRNASSTKASPASATVQGLRQPGGDQGREQVTAPVQIEVRIGIGEGARGCEGLARQSAHRLDDAGVVHQVRPHLAVYHIRARGLLSGLVCHVKPSIQAM